MRRPFRSCCPTAIAWLAAKYRAATFWALIHGSDLICLTLARAPDAPDPGLRTGHAVRIDETRIPQALAERTDSFVTEANAPLATMLVPMRNRRGHDLGWIGLTIDSRAPAPPAGAIQADVAALTDAH